MPTNVQAMSCSHFGLDLKKFILLNERNTTSVEVTKGVTRIIIIIIIILFLEVVRKCCLTCRTM